MSWHPLATRKTEEGTELEEGFVLVKIKGLDGPPAERIPVDGVTVFSTGLGPAEMSKIWSAVPGWDQMFGS